MVEKNLKLVAEACGARFLRGTPETPWREVCLDSRQVQPGDLFFAVKGDRFDGHDYLPEAAGRGAAAVVVEAGKWTGEWPACAVLEVPQVRPALGQLAARWRLAFETAIIAVAGSNGKTTTKELVAAILATDRATLKSEASLNNDIGVPMTLLKLTAAHQAAVLEAGTNHPGELAPLVAMIQPQHGIITSIGREHLEFFKDLAGVAGEEGMLAELLPATGCLYLNGDSEWTETLVRRTRATVVRAGLGPNNDWHARSVRLDKSGVTFRVEAPLADFNGEYRIPLLGRHQVTNALLAMAVGARLGVGPAAVRTGLLACQPPKMRLQFWEANGVRVLNDAYNANADSTLAALATLCDLPLQGRRVAVLGDMNELGAQAEAAHREVGQRVAELGVGQLFAVGKMAAITAGAAREAGLGRVLEFATVEAAIPAVKGFLKAGDVVLFKASRGCALERIADTLKPVKN